MKKHAVALVARAGTSRVELARYLRDGGYDVHECEELAIATRFVGVVIVDDEPSDAMRAHVGTWLRHAQAPRVVVLSSKPTSWRALALAHSEHVTVVAAPAFSWEVLDALRANPPVLPGGA